MDDYERYHLNSTSPSRGDRNFDTCHLTQSHHIEHLWIAYIDADPDNQLIQQQFGDQHPLMFGFFKTTPTTSIAKLGPMMPTDKFGYNRLHLVPNDSTDHTHYAIMRPTRGIPTRLKDCETTFVNPITPAAASTYQANYNAWFTRDEYHRLCELSPPITTKTRALAKRAFAAATLNPESFTAYQTQIDDLKRTFEENTIHIKQEAPMPPKAESLVQALAGAIGSAVTESITDKVKEGVGLKVKEVTHEQIEELKQNIKLAVEKINEAMNTNETKLEGELKTALATKSEQQTAEETRKLLEETLKAVQQLQTIEDSMAIEQLLTQLGNTTCRILKCLQNRPMCITTWPQSGCL